MNTIKENNTIKDTIKSTIDFIKDMYRLEKKKKIRNREEVVSNDLITR